MKILMTVILLIAPLHAAHSSSLPKNLEINLTCFANCQRGVVKKVNGRWSTVAEAVRTFSVHINKTDHQFKMAASSQDVGGSIGHVDVSLVYQAKIDDNGLLTGSFTQGTLAESGELQFRDMSSNCGFVSRPELGQGTLDVSCKIGSELDFSGLAKVSGRQ